MLERILTGEQLTLMDIFFYCLAAPSRGGFSYANDRIVPIFFLFFLFVLIL